MSSKVLAPKIKLKTDVKLKAPFIFGSIFFIYAVLSFNPYKIKMTSTASVDHSVFFVKNFKPTDITVGEYITITEPNKPYSGEEFVKLVAGVAGDKVVVEGRDIYVGGVYRGRAKEVSLKGRELEVTQGGVIPEGMLYVFAPHKDSYDSRYAEIGFISVNTVTGKARPVL